MRKHFLLILMMTVTFLTVYNPIQAGEAKVVVIKLENQKIIAGFGGQGQPAIQLPAVVGYTRGSGLGMIGMGSKPVYGQKALDQKSQLRLSYAMQGRRITNFQDFEKLIHHLLYQELKVDPSEVNIFVLDAETGSSREKLARYFFESLNIENLFMMNKALSWQKASGISVQSSFKEMYMTKDEYDERGAPYIHKKFR